jgi:hypothetical protein
MRVQHTFLVRVGLVLRVNNDGGSLEQERARSALEDADFEGLIGQDLTTVRYPSALEILVDGVIVDADAFESAKSLDCADIVSKNEALKTKVTALEAELAAHVAAPTAPGKRAVAKS